MVRIKHRYLLINILYPVGQATQLKVSAAGLPDLVHFHQPTSTNFSHDMLRRLIRDGVTELFGDYGAGMIAGSLKGTCAIISLVTGGSLNHEPFALYALATNTNRSCTPKSCIFLQPHRPQSFAYLARAIGLFGLRCHLRQSFPTL